MVVSLLPASAAAFAPRAAPTIVLTSVESWLTQTLRRINRIKRPSNNVPQHTRVLADVLGGPDAIWSLCAIMLPKAPDAQLPKSSNSLLEAFNYQIVHVLAYVVHVDLVSQHEVAFKLTSDTILALIRYHRHIYLVDMAASTWDWPEKQTQIERLHADFVQAVNKFVFRTDKRALEGMEERGAGELLEGRSLQAKNGILSLFMPLLPPPPEMLEVVIQAQASIPSSTGGPSWFPTVPSQSMPGQPTAGSSRMQTTSTGPAIVPSQPSPACNQHSTSALDFALWSDLGLDIDLGLELEALESSLGLPSPALTTSKSQTFSATPTPTSFAALTGTDESGVSFATDCNIAILTTSPLGSVSPVSQQYANAGMSSSSAIVSPCGHNLVAAPLLDLSLGTATLNNWACPDIFAPLYGTAP